MKTLKLISIQIAIIFSITLIGSSLNAQNADILNIKECASCNDAGKGRLYFSPLNVISPVNSSLQLTYGKTVTKNSELIVSLAQLVPDGHRVQLFKNSISDDWRTIGGFRAGVEMQQMIVNSKRGHIYGAIELFKMRVRKLNGENFTEVSFNSSDYRVKRVTQHIKGMNAKMGWKQYISKRIFFDAYVGIGLSTRKDHWTNMDGSNPVIKTRNALGWQLRGNSIPWNFKIGYDL